jgi:CheY-like chemotaxis protein
MNLDSLLLSRDINLLGVIRPTLEHLAIDVEICQEARAATEILLAEKFDAVIVDCDDLVGGLEVLQGLRATPSNKNSVTFAILNGKKTTTKDAFDLGANFVLQKPINTLNASRCFNAALSFMEKERRRYFRQPIKIAVDVVLDEKELKATSTNISEGGMALMLRQALPKGATPHLKFVLPDINLSLNVEAEIAWADIKGRVGCRFHNVPQSSQQLLEKWLDERMEKEFPGSKARIAPADPAQPGNS